MVIQLAQKTYTVEEYLELNLASDIRNEIASTSRITSKLRSINCYLLNMTILQ
ncbi:hypothetical protein HCU40_17960 [Pseudanabaena biceps]|nr:hypothetical protein [Pseudanabaena biceps]